jgi:hypothetical protein
VLAKIGHRMAAELFTTTGLLACKLKSGSTGEVDD